MRPITVMAPSGTIVNPVLPAACAARGVIGYRVFDAIMGALAQIVPDKVIAASEGGPTLFSIGGYDRGRVFVLTEVMVGTWGARAGLDGVEGISNPAANLSNQPVELIEAELPLQVVHYGFVPDSGGAGRFRGGLAFTREWRLLADEAVVTVRSDRRFHPPYGVAGGKAGRPSRNVLRTSSGAARAAADADGRVGVAARRFIPPRRRRRRRLSAMHSRAIRRWCWRTCWTRRCRSRRRVATTAWRSIRRALAVNAAETARLRAERMG